MQLDAAAAQNVTLITDQNTFLQKRYDQTVGDIPKVQAAASEMQPVLTLVERFDIEPFSDFSAK